MTNCPTCGKKIGKWDQIFLRLKAGKAVLLSSRTEAQNAHRMAEERGLRVRTEKVEDHRFALFLEFDLSGDDGDFL